MIRSHLTRSRPNRKSDSSPRALFRWNTRWTYDVYVANGPNLDTVNPGTAGSSTSTIYRSEQQQGGRGRIGFLPIPEMEMGYSLQYSKPNPSGFQSVDALMQARISTTSHRQIDQRPA